MSTKGYLLAAFGTGDPDLFQRSFLSIYRHSAPIDTMPCAFCITSDRIRKKLLRSGAKPCLYSPEEAAEFLLQRGVKDLLVDAMFLSDAGEYRKLRTLCLGWKERFETVRLTLPWLKRDLEKVSTVLMELLPDNQEKQYVLIGHGSKDSSNEEYRALENMLEVRGREDIRVVLAEGPHEIEELLEDLYKSKWMKNESTLAFHPLMFCAGHHIHEIYDMLPGVMQSMDQPYEVSLKGLGEYENVATLFSKISLRSNGDCSDPEFECL